MSKDEETVTKILKGQKEKEFEDFIQKVCVVSPKEGLASVKLAKIRHMRKEITRLMKEDARAQSKESKPQRSRRTLSRFSTLDHKSFTRTSMQFG